MHERSENTTVGITIKGTTQTAENALSAQAQQQSDVPLALSATREAKIAALFERSGDTDAIASLVRECEAIEVHNRDSAA